MSAANSPAKRVILLGSTGSIGTSALKVARDIPERMQIVGLAANSSADALVQQARETGVKHVALTDAAAAAKAKAQLPDGVTLHTGTQGLIDLVNECEADMVLVAIVGTVAMAIFLPILQLMSAIK